MALLVAHELPTEQRQGGGDRQKIIFSSCVRPVLVVSRLFVRSRPRSVHTTPEEFENEAYLHGWLPKTKGDREERSWERGWVRATVHTNR